jgi:hypothetical protein
MVSPTNNEPNILKLGVTGDDFTGLVQAVKVIHHFVENEVIADECIKRFMDDNKHSADILHPDSVKAGFAQALHVMGRSITQAAKTAEKGWLLENPQDEQDNG